jgi:hypothetical protein
VGLESESPLRHHRWYTKMVPLIRVVDHPCGR